MRGSGLFVLVPSGQVTLGAVVQSLPEASDRARRPESTLRPTPGDVSLSGCPSARSHVCLLASLTHPGWTLGPARLSSLRVQLPNRKSERATRRSRRMRTSRSEPPRRSRPEPAERARFRGRASPASVRSRRRRGPGGRTPGEPAAPGAGARVRKGRSTSREPGGPLEEGATCMRKSRGPPWE